MKSKKIYPRILFAAITAIFLVLLCGCAAKEKKPAGSSQNVSETNASVSLSQQLSTSPSTSEERIATTTTETWKQETAPDVQTTSGPATTVAPANLPNGGACETDGQCKSGCCTDNNGRAKCRDASICELKDLGEQDCYKKGIHWCIDECQKADCGKCDAIMRCVNVSEGGSETLKVETATEVSGQAGSCLYSRSYVNAGGIGGYCDKHEGTLIYAKCGSPSQAEDCLRIYKDNVMYWIAQKRSFHSPQGEASDLWCFKCTQAV